jgi:hypothetical protein
LQDSTIGKRFRTTSAAKMFRAGNLALVLLGLATLVGCQGFSVGKTTSQTTTNSGGLLDITPANQSFGSVTVGTQVNQTVTLSNNSGATVNISQVSISGTGFKLSGISVPLALPDTQSTTFTVSFAPQSAGVSVGSATITSDASNSTITMALSGTGVTDSVATLVSNPSSLSFGTLQVGDSQKLSATVTNSGSASATISKVAISGSGFTLSGITAPVTLDAGQSVNFSVTFAPQSTGSVTGNVTITSDASNSTFSVPLSGTAVSVAIGALASNPASLSFGSVVVGDTQKLSATVTNSGDATANISKVAISGSGFTLSGITAPLALAAGQSATFSVTFAPQASGNASGAVTLTSDASNPTLTVPLSGTGTNAPGQLTATPSTLAIGNVVVGNSGTGTGKLSASGANVTVTAASSNNSRFTISGLSLPLTIPAGQSASFTVTFSPQVTGADSATLTFTSNAQLSSTTETVTGTGTPAPTHTVNLSWNASTSSNVTGYNIYRAVYVNSCGTYAKINGSTLDTATVYTDSSVADGTAYCYATTAVNSSNEESSYSNIVANLKIPTQ